MVNPLCPICHKNDADIDQFRFLPCGHGFCIKCTLRIQAPSCAICRRPINPTLDYHPIYLICEEPNVNRANRVAENLDKIGTASAGTSVQKAGPKIRRALGAIRAERAVARSLLDAASRLEERVYPLFVTVERQREQISALEQELLQSGDARRKVAERSTPDEELERLRRKLNKVEQRYEAASSLTETLQDQLRSQQDENSRLNSAIRQREKALRQLEKESKDQADNRDKEIRLLKRKLKVLAKQARPPVHEADESLQIEYVQEPRGSLREAR